MSSLSWLWNVNRAWSSFRAEPAWMQSSTHSWLAKKGFWIVHMKYYVIIHWFSPDYTDYTDSLTFIIIKITTRTSHTTYTPVIYHLDYGCQRLSQEQDKLWYNPVSKLHCGNILLCLFKDGTAKWASTNASRLNRFSPSELLFARINKVRAAWSTLLGPMLLLDNNHCACSSYNAHNNIKSGQRAVSGSARLWCTCLDHAWNLW